MKKTERTTPGTRRAVCRVLRFQDVPCNKPSSKQNKKKAKQQIWRCLHHLVEASRDVAGLNAHEGVEHQNGSEQRATIGRRQKAKHRHRQRHSSHCQHLCTNASEQRRQNPPKKLNLNAIAHKDGEKHFLSRRTKHVAMHQLPACFFLRLFLSFQFAIPDKKKQHKTNDQTIALSSSLSEISRHRFQHDHSHNSRQKDNNHDGVDD